MSIVQSRPETTRVGGVTGKGLTPFLRGGFACPLERRSSRLSDSSWTRNATRRPLHWARPSSDSSGLGEHDRLDAARGTSRRLTCDPGSLSLCSPFSPRPLCQLAGKLEEKLVYVVPAMADEGGGPSCQSRQTDGLTPRGIEWPRRSGHSSLIVMPLPTACARGICRLGRPGGRN